MYSSVRYKEKLNMLTLAFQEKTGRVIEFGLQDDIYIFVLCFSKKKYKTKKGQNKEMTTEKGSYKKR